MRLTDVLEILEKAEIIGNGKDEPEGSRFIQISETLNNQMIKCIRNLLDGCDYKM